MSNNFDFKASKIREYFKIKYSKLYNLIIQTV